MRPRLFLRVLPLLFLLPCSTWAQTPADITAEPHHKLLLQNDQVRVFSLTLRPTDQAFVRHEHNFLWVTLNDGELVMWTEGVSPVQHYQFPQGDVRFYTGGISFGLRNDRSSDYHGVMVEFLNPKVTTYGYQYQTGDWNYGSGTMSPPVDPHIKFVDRMSLGMATASDMQLLAGDSLPPPQKKAAELIIPVTAIDLMVNGDRHIRKSPGEVMWMDAGRKSDFSNASGGPIRFVVVELQKSSSP